MNKPLLLAVTQDEGQQGALRHAFAGSPFALRFCQTAAAALEILSAEAVSVLAVDFHPVAAEPAAFLRVLREPDPALAPVALCRPEDMASAVAAQAAGDLGEIVQLPLEKAAAQAQACRAAAAACLRRTAEAMPELAERLAAAKDRPALAALLSAAFVDGPRAVFSSLSADFGLGKAGWHRALFADPGQAAQLEAMAALALRLARGAAERLALPDENAGEEYDKLSGVFNRAGLGAALEREVDRSRRYGSPLALMVLDLDGFAELNRVFGRQTGDRVLKGVGNILDGLTRRTDVIARLENDEFCLVLPGIDLEHSLKAVGRVRHELGSWAGAALRDVPITLSFGLAAYRGPAAGPAQLLEDALAALGHARAQGSGMVGLYDGEFQIAKEPA